MSHLRENLILQVDSYKSSHFLAYPPGTTKLFSYAESRGGKWPFALFFGLQYTLKRYLSTPVTMEDVEEAKTFFAAHGEPFPYDGWKHIVNKHGGFLPIHIRAVEEGSVVPNHNVLMTVESTDPEVFWIASWVESMLLRALWYPITVATQSFVIKQTILEYLQETGSDNPYMELPFKLHDFGARGVSSSESAGIGGMAHLVNFMGSDTVEGIRYANHYYNHPMAAFSIPALEHSTVTSWGRENEAEAYRNAIKRFGGPGKLVACVSDSYDLWNTIDNMWGGELLEEVKASGATIVIRPDSGDPVSVVLKTMQMLEAKVGCTLNNDGYKVLPSYYRVIQGDGVNEQSIEEILSTLKRNGYAASNIAFGMGGALLQKLDRDTLKFAYKCSMAVVNGVEVPVFKDPITDPGKSSKKGRLDLIVSDHNGDFITVDYPVDPADSALNTVYLNGNVMADATLTGIRNRSDGFLE